MAWSDVIKAIPDVFYKVAKLAVDIQNVQKDVEELQKQNRTLAETNVRQEEQIKQLLEEVKKNSALFERILKLENELTTLKALQQAHNDGHLNKIKMTEYDLKDHLNQQVKGVEGSLVLKFSKLESEFKAALYDIAQNQPQPPQKFTPRPTAVSALLPAEDNDGQGKA